MSPNQSKYIVISVYDHETIWADELVGSFKIPIGTVPEAPVTKWANLYGAPINSKGQYTDLMNLYGDIMGI